MVKKKALVMSVLFAVASVGFVVSASAEETMSGKLDEVVVEAERGVLPGGFVASEDKVGILGSVDIMDVPFTQTKYTEKTIGMFSDPNQPLNGVLANNPAIRIGSPSPMYTDFSMRGVNMNGNHYVLNGVPNLFGQFMSLPTGAIDSVEVIAGANTVLNGSTGFNDGGNSDGAPAGMIYATTKKATDAPITRYTQTFSGKSTWGEHLDIGRRFGKNNEWGVRVNAHYEDGGLAIDGAEKKDRNIFINIDHKDENSTTNIFAGHYDFAIKGGQRWLKAGNVTKGNLVDAPDNSNNLSFGDQIKTENGYIMTLNHEQKFNDNISAFFTAGTSQTHHFKFDPYGGSLNIYDGGELKGALRNQKSESRNVYLQAGLKGEFNIGAIKNHMTVAVDRYWSTARSSNKYNSSNGSVNDIFGNVWDGVYTTASVPLDNDLQAAKWSKQKIVSVTLADRMEFGKWNAYWALQKRDAETIATNGNSTSNDKVSPSYALAYRPTENLSVYASHSEGYTSKPILVTDTAAANYNEVLDPHKTKQNEIGVKFKTGKVLNTLAYFDMTKGSYLKADNPGDPWTIDGEENYKGVEYTITGNITDKWNLLGGFMYVNAKQERTLKHANDGKRVNGVPKWNAVLAGEYQADENNSAVIRANYTGKSHVNDNGVTAPDYITFDLGYKHKTEINTTPVTLSLMCYNAFGKDYWISRGTSVALGAPRTFMLSAQFDI